MTKPVPKPIVDNEGNSYPSVDAWMAEVKRRAAERAAHPERYTEQQRKDPTIPEGTAPARARYDGKADLRTIHAMVCGPLPPKVEAAIREIGARFVREYQRRTSLPACPPSAPSDAAAAGTSAPTPRPTSRRAAARRARTSTPARSTARTRRASTTTSATRRTGGLVAS